MTKYNGESLTTWEPRGKDQAVHLAMSKLGPHVVNVHILSNLEPFRYGDVEFIKKCVQASRDRLGATGMHLYPLVLLELAVFAGHREDARAAMAIAIGCGSRRGRAMRGIPTFRSRRITPSGFRS
jgi:hypothetical protein